MTQTQTGFSQLITSNEELHQLIGQPSELVKQKTLSRLDQACRDFIARSPLALVSTSDEQGRCDVSPRGDAPGFALVLNDNQLVLPERPGNRRADTLSNILANPNIGLLFIIPGVGHTLRVNGRAYLTRDTGLLQPLTAQGKTPLLAIGIEVEEAFLHCAKAFIRSKLWDSTTWPESGAVKTLGQLLVGQGKALNFTAEQADCLIDEGYRTTLY